tara:strand:- start:383 stop:745 length:363 start_codon:yes stop_codon:yes gene_type:complete
MPGTRRPRRARLFQCDHCEYKTDRNRYLTAHKLRRHASNAERPLNEEARMLEIRSDRALRDKRVVFVRCGAPKRAPLPAEMARCAMAVRAAMRDANPPDVTYVNYTTPRTLAALRVACWL